MATHPRIPSKGFCFSEVSDNTVIEILRKLNLSKATGLDNLSARFIKDSQAHCVVFDAYFKRILVVQRNSG